MDEPVIRVVCFELCGGAFAFNMDYLIEIVQIRASEITPCFTPVPFVRGMWMYRSHAVYVIDFRDFFRLPCQAAGRAPGPQAADEQQSAATPPEQRDKSMLVVRMHGQVFAMFSDAVLQVVPLGVFYEYPDFVSTLPRRYFAGIIRVRGALALVLAIDQILGEYEVELLKNMESPPSAG